MVASRLLSLLKLWMFCRQKLAGESTKQLYSGNRAPFLTFSTCKQKLLKVTFVSWLLMISMSLNTSNKGPRYASVSCRSLFHGSTTLRSMIC